MCDKHMKGVLTMMSLKTRFLLFLNGLVFRSTVPTLAEVVNQMSDCDQFLLQNTPPQLPGILHNGTILNQNQYKPICQTFQNQRRFVTLYDTKNKIPVFSACKYRGGEGGRPPTYWKVEPQLEHQDDMNMIIGHSNKTYNKQAGTADYRNNGYFDRGHLFPSSYAFSRADKMSTFTLTNIVPQADTFNQRSWSRMEMCIKCVMDKYCINNNNLTEGFVVVGAKPSANNTLKNRVNIPSMLWSAFCCYSSKIKAWVASAHWGNNVRDDSKYKHLPTKTLAQLHQELGAADGEFEVFPRSQCPLNTTVAKFYPEILRKCHCTPHISKTSKYNRTSSKFGVPTSSSGPATSTFGFNQTNSGPPESSSGPTASSGPPESSSGQQESSSDPTVSSGPPESSSGPPESSSGPTESSSGPPASSSGPSESHSGPPTSSGPPESSSGQQESSSGPPESSSGQQESSSGQQESSSGPPESSSDPPESSSGPPASSSGPPESSSDPPESSSGPPASSSGTPASSSGPPASSPDLPEASSNAVTTSEIPNTTSDYYRSRLASPGERHQD